MALLSAINPKYMTVSVDVMQQGLNVSIWFTTERFWHDEIAMFPHSYDVQTGDCNWKVHSNSELTHKVLMMATEYADKICAENLAINNRRKIANR